MIGKTIYILPTKSFRFMILFISQLLVLCLILSFLSQPSMTSAQVDLEVIDINATPELLSKSHQNYTLIISQDWNSTPINSFHSVVESVTFISISIKDNHSGIFDINDYYRLKLEFDYVNTIFDPDPVERTLEDEGSITYIFEELREQSDVMALELSAYSVFNSSVALAIDVEIKTLRVLSHNYNIGQYIYKIQTIPIASKFETFGGIGVSYADATHVFWDSNLIAFLQEYDLEVPLSISLDVLTYSEDDDTIRIEFGDRAKTTKMDDAHQLDYTISIDRIMELVLSVTGGPAVIQITGITIELDLSTLQHDYRYPNLPKYGFIAPIILYVVAYGFVYKYIRVQIELEEENL